MAGAIIYSNPIEKMWEIIDKKLGKCNKTKNCKKTNKTINFSKTIIYILFVVSISLSTKVLIGF